MAMCEHQWRGIGPIIYVGDKVLYDYLLCMGCGKTGDAPREPQTPDPFSSVGPNAGALGRDPQTPAPFA